MGKISHGEIHRRTGLSLSHVNRTLNGRRTPSIRVMEQIAGVIRVSIDDLHQYLKRRRADKQAA